ncbi:MAG TPA: cytochrome c [Verrucomicrobiae bacterium]|jgi:mono/diheme cytochrome c family protein|nr:cytochrome c [Verrucomicrobiae bacterium]
MSLEPNKPFAETMDDAPPRSNYTAAPVLLIALFALMTFIGMAYLEDHGGEFNSQVYTPYVSYQEVKDHQIHDPLEDFRIAGGRIYSSTCAACHQASGSGSAAVNAPPLAGSEWVNAEGPNRVLRIVMNGLKGPVTVKGQQFGAGVMAAWKETYSDEQLAQILSYIRGNKDWGNNAPPITTEQVHAMREKLKTRSVQDAFTSDELLKIPEKD